MAQVVQATCPGCKSTLRIPSEWVGKAFRCKRCDTVIQARQPVASASSRPIPRLPPPPPMPSVGPSDKTPVPMPSRAVPRPALPPAPPENEQVKAAPPPAPVMAPPVATPVFAPARAQSFEFGDEPAIETPTTSRATRRRKPKKGSWTPFLIAFGLLALTGGLVAFGWPMIRDAVNAKVAEDAASEEGDGTPTTPKVASGGTKGKGKGKAAPANAQFPRRAMIISVHDYLYANPLHDLNGTPNIAALVRSLNNGLRIPLDQVIHLSDGAKKNARPPLKPIIEEGLSNFLKTCRAQDRILVFFIGHTKEIDNKAYLVPLEGEMENASTLIPLDWVYDQLAKCPARQKILVLDGNRFNAAQGEERPAAGEMGPKFEETLKNPPKGVQVFAACSKAQQSHEFEEASLGLFLDSFRIALTPGAGQKGALQGRIQTPNDLIPMDAITENVKTRMAGESAKRKLPQVPIVAGTVPAEGTDYDPDEALASIPAMPAIKSTDTTVVRAIMDEISVPPLKNTGESTMAISFSSLPPFPEGSLKKFTGGELPAESKLREAIHKARVALWGLSTATAPASIAADVKTFKDAMKSDLSIMKESYTRPSAAGETAFKNNIVNDLRSMAKILARLERLKEELDEVKDMVDEAPPRWKAHYQFMYARFLAQLTYVESYQGLLGDMRKEYPTPYDPAIHSGYKMAAQLKSTDSVGKKYDKIVRTTLGKLAKEAAGTPWEVLAKRESLTALGLQWQAY